MRPNPSLDDLPLRPELVGEEPYGAPQLDVPVCLNVNENPYPPSDELRREMAEAIVRVAGRIDRYPDREASGLRRALASYLDHGLTAANIWAANGSNEVLQQVLQAFGGPGRSLLSFTPTYSMYPLLASGTDTEWIPVPRPDDFALTPQGVAEAPRPPATLPHRQPGPPTGVASADRYEVHGGAFQDVVSGCVGPTTSPAVAASAITRGRVVTVSSAET